jgi:hypothetical protein
VQGYLQVASSATRIAGMVQFGDLAGDRFHTALPLASEGNSEVLYAQVVENASYFTGLAVINPDAVATELRIAVFNSLGERLGGRELALKAGARLSGTLRELVPELPEMSSGYFTLSTGLPTISFTVFGTHSLTALAALPAQPAQHE